MKNEELIALYFQNKLNTSQKARFEELLKTDEAFKSQVILEEQLKTAIISTKKDELRNTLKQIEHPKKRFNYYTIAIAASLIIAFGIFSLLQPANTVSNHDLFTQYFEPYTNVIAPASRGDETKDDTSEAFRYYDTKNFKMASEKFKNLYTTTNTSYYLFYQGICELELENTENAIKLFNAHTNYTDKLSKHTNWYLALAYLKANNTKETKKLLQIIIINKSYNYKASKDIFEKLK